MIKSGAKSNPVLTALTGRNDELFSEIVRLYAEDGWTIADVTYGKGAFWKKVDTSRFVCKFTDLNNGIDMCNLPYEDQSIDMWVCDPPYMYSPKGTVKASLSNPYNLNGHRPLKTNADVLALYYDALDEASRVLKKGGLAVVKCQDIIQSNTPRWNHISIYEHAMTNGFIAKDFFVLVQTMKPAIRWDHQYHGRKNHSYFWIFQKK
jgi:hypothetical protein